MPSDVTTKFGLADAVYGYDMLLSFADSNFFVQLHAAPVD